MQDQDSKTNPSGASSNATASQPSTRAADLTMWLGTIDRRAAELLAPQIDERMNNPRVIAIRQLAAKEPEDLYTPGTMRGVLSAVDIDDGWPEEDRAMYIDVLCSLLPEHQLDAIATRAKAELDKIDELNRQHETHIERLF